MIKFHVIKMKRAEAGPVQVSCLHSYKRYVWNRLSTAILHSSSQEVGLGFGFVKDIVTLTHFLF